jgi:molecular chaperone GrpE (heat shock protein)
VKNPSTPWKLMAALRPIRDLMRGHRRSGAASSTTPLPMDASTPSPMQTAFKDVVDSVTRSTSAATREHGRFERQLQENSERLAAKTDEAVVQLGRSLLKVGEEVKDIQAAIRQPLLMELATTHAALERCRTSRRYATDPASWEQWADGVVIIADRVERDLRRWGLARIPTDDAAYNVKLHQTMERKVVPGHPPDRIIQEVEPGYYSPETGQVLVRARVIVSGGPASPAEEV